MMFSVGDLQVFLQKLVQLPLVADAILLGMRALRLYFVRFIRIKIHVVYAQQEHKHNCLDKHARASHVTP